MSVNIMGYPIIAMLTLVGVCLSEPALADARDDALAAISRCTVIPDDRGFSNCVESAVQQLRARSGLSGVSATQAGPPAAPIVGLPTPQSTAVNSASASPRSKKGGWLSSVFGSSARKPTLHMDFYTFDAHGMFTVALKNGEIWRQMDSDSGRAHWRAPASNYSVTVKEGIFGASILEVSGEQTHYLVERLR
jgi:hypothetical protein